MAFITAFLDYTKELEACDSYFLWASYAAVAGILRDNCYLQQRKGPLFPNIYVLLLADSAVARKDAPLGIAYDMMYKIKNTKLIRGRASVQAILQELGTPEMDKKTGVTLSGGSAFICAAELSAFFVADPAAVPIMTDIYDYRHDYPISLKGSGKMIVHDVCVSMLSASNERLLRAVYDGNAIFGGLMGRTFFIKPDVQRRPPNSLFEESENNTKMIEEYTTAVDQLREISKLKGRFEVTNEAKVEYELWYNHLYESYLTKVDKSGVIGRIHTGVLKVAMVRAVGYRCELKITKEDIEGAIEQCTHLLPNYEMFAMSSGRSTTAAAGSIFFSEIWDSATKSISRKSFIRKHWTEIDELVLDNLVTVLEAGGLIKAEIMAGSLDTTYTLTELGIQQIKEKM